MKPYLSLIYPVCNAEQTIEADLYRMLEYVATLDTSFEIIIMDTGSIDETFVTVCEMARKYPQVRIKRIATKCGLGRVMATADEFARGQILFIHDGSPGLHLEAISRLWALQRQGTVTGQEEESLQNHFNTGGSLCTKPWFVCASSHADNAMPKMPVEIHSVPAMKLRTQPASARRAFSLT